ncbi:myoD family inhibitor domain-containing protein isoform X1 [Tachysurus ichikawai]
MSAETVLPPEGPVGPDKQQHETSLLLANSQDTCQTDAKGLSDTTEKSTAPPSRDRCVGVQEDMSTESPAHGDPIRTLKFNYANGGCEVSAIVFMGKMVAKRSS